MYKKTILTAALILTLISPVYANIKLKVVVVNPSDKDEKTTPVRYDLPKDIGPEDIVDIGDMELNYDFEKGVYYVSQTVTLKPAEKKLIEVTLGNVWVVPKDDIKFLEGRIIQLTDKLKGTKHEETGKALSERSKAKLEQISKEQDKPGLSAKERINIYYENIGILREVKEDIGMVENLVLDVGGILEDRVYVPRTMAVSLREDYDKGAVEEKDIVTINVSVANPSKDKKQTVSLKYSLPEEITPRYVIDNSGLDMNYDFDNQSYYVFKDNIELEPAETKAFAVKVKDIWKIPEVDIDGLRAHTKNLMMLFNGTDYYNQAKGLEENIFTNLDRITSTQSEAVEVKQHIAYYRENTILLTAAQDSVNQIEKIAARSGSLPNITIAKSEKFMGGGSKIRKRKGFEGLDFIARSVFRGKALKASTTWKIIFIILGFTGVIGAIFFMLWYQETNKQMRDKKRET